MISFRKSLSIYRQDLPLYILALPGLLFLLLFCYIPMAGLVVVFKDYNFQDGIFGSPWVGLKNFEFFFYSAEKAWRATKNTLILNSSFIIFGTFFSVALAIMFNEIKNLAFKRITQSLSFLPYFISWVVLGGICTTILDYEKGTLNKAIEFMGFAPVDFYMQPEYWVLIFAVANIWKTCGYGAVVYLAVITGIDQSYYEAATVDGATKMQQIMKITIPLLRPTIVILTLMSIGRILYGDLTMIMGMTNLNPVLLPTTDIIDSFVYRSVIGSGEFSMASAIGLYQSVFGFILVVASNYFAGRLDKDFKIF